MLSEMANKRYIIVTVECSSCKTKQQIHVLARAGAWQMVNARIRCINCGYHFEVSLSDEILRGPFPA
jgi:Zn ribbon nucleic-acid-binding protein